MSQPARTTPRLTAGREHSWVLARLAYPLAERTRDGWRGLPRDVRRRWLLRMTGGFVLATLVCVGLTLWAMRLDAAGAFAWEREALLSLPDQVPLSYHDAVWLGAIGSTAMLVPIVVTAAILLALRDHVLSALSLAAGYFLAKPLIFTGWWIWDRPRPDFIEDAVAVPAGLQSFPSGHVLQTVAVYGFLVWLWVRQSRSTTERILAWGLLGLITVSQVGARLRIGAHWPSDIAAALVVGTVWCIAMAWALEKAEGEVRALGE